VKATKVNAGLAESNGRLLLGIWRDSLHVTCGLTACTPGSAPSPTLGNEYGKTLPLPFTRTVYAEQGLRNGTLFVRLSSLSISLSHLPAAARGGFAAVGPTGRSTGPQYGAHCSSKCG